MKVAGAETTVALAENAVTTPLEVFNVVAKSPVIFGLFSKLDANQKLPNTRAAATVAAVVPPVIE